MATTTRKNRDKKPTIKLVEHVKQVEVAPEKKDHLSADHLLQLETKSRDIENAKLEMALEEQYLRNLTLEQALLVAKIEKQKLLLREKAVKYENSKNSYVNIKKELWQQYGFNEEDGLAYDVNTGKIIRN